MWFTSSPKKGAAIKPRQSIGEETSNSILGNTANSSLEAGRRTGIAPKGPIEPPLTKTALPCPFVSLRALIMPPHLELIAFEPRHAIAV